jgi:transmembrane sensor
MSADSHQPISDAVAQQAAAWVARRDRGLTAAEQDAYMQWLAADPQHAEAVARHAAALERMMQLYEWQPSNMAAPNPDLFAPVGDRRWRRRWMWTAGLAAAAAVALAAWWMRPGDRSEQPQVAAAPKSHLRVNERLALPDGSRVELKDGSRVVVLYSDRERRVRLADGEAHFSVWQDPARPFVVEAAGVEVRAIGTAFNVRLATDRVEVLVTEGRVKLQADDTHAHPETAARAPAAGGLTPTAPPAASSGATLLQAGERAVVPLVVAEPAAPVVTRFTAEEAARELAWQAPRLQFHETPLAEAVAEFNRLNRHQLVLGEPGLAVLRIGGTFRPDNVEGFVRLLDTALGVRAESDGESRTVLRRGR